MKEKVLLKNMLKRQNLIMFLREENQMNIKTRNFKVSELHINEPVASGVVRGLIYRVTFNHVPTEKETILAIRHAASINEVGVTNG